VNELRIGGQIVDRDEALNHARDYLTSGTQWAYPSYDGFDAEHAHGPIVDADLLAPLLLNVNRISISTYEALQGVRQQLQERLDLIPADRSLVDASAEDLEDLGLLFGVLDGAGISGARGTVLSKVLHRKRPGFIPLYDRQVGRVYQEGEEPPVPAVRGRTWQQFAPLFAAAVEVDLRRELSLWQEISALAPSHPITPLRALDIVAWWAGRR